MRPALFKQKLRVLLISLLVSAVVLGGILAVVYIIWYPTPYDRIQGIHRVTWILVAVQLALGPVLTAVLYKKGKKGLKIDLTVVVALQVFALGYGTVALYLERPWFTVFADDHFRVLARREVDMAAIDDARFLAGPRAGPVMVIANMPGDPGEAQRLLEEILFEDQPGLAQRPRYWSGYAEGLDQVLARARTLGELRAGRPHAAPEIDRLPAGLSRNGNGLVKYRDFAAVLDPENGAMLAAVATNPWLR